MQSLEVVYYQSEAHLLKDLLKSHGIECNVIGSRNYSSIVLGGSEGRYTIYVPEQQMNDARRLLRELRVTDASATSDIPQTPNSFRRAIFFAFAATLILPIVFNYASLTHGRIYWQTSDKSWTARLKLSAIILLQLPAVLLMAFIIRSIINTSLAD